MSQQNPLQQAYAHLEAGSPMKALAVVLGVLRQRFGGDERRVFEFIQQARAAHQSQQHYEMLVRELQQLSLGQDDDAAGEAPTAAEQEAADALLRELLADESILGKAGRGQVMLDAHSDGSSVVCDRCHQLIAAARWDQHVRFWCPARSHAASDDDGDDEEGSDADGASHDQDVRGLEHIMQGLSLRW